MSDPLHTTTSIEKLEDAILELISLNLTLGESVHSMNLRFDTLLQHISSPSSLPTSITPSVHVSSTTHVTNHRMKLDVPRFDGNGPLGWIFKINQFFYYHHTLEQDKLTIASFYMEGRALA